MGITTEQKRKANKFIVLSWGAAGGLGADSTFDTYAEAKEEADLLNEHSSNDLFLVYSRDRRYRPKK